MSAIFYMKKASLYKSINEYFIVEEMRNETTMWYIAGGLLAQYLRSKQSLFSSLKSSLGYKTKNKSVEILDVCSGPGTFANYLSFVNPSIKATCIDLDNAFVSYGQKHYRKWRFLKADALTINLKKKFDVITVSSGYHHIEDKDKVKFLENLSRHLSTRGIIILCDNFLPEYKSQSERDKAVRIYYRELRKYYSEGNGSTRALNALDDVEKRDLKSEDEYKVSFEIFKRHLSRTDLLVDQDIQVLKLVASSKAGSHVLILKKR